MNHLETKVCTSCSEEKDSTEFRKSRNKCRACEKLDSQAQHKAIRDRLLSGEGSETCTRCARELPVLEFSMGGTSFVCKTCRACALYGITLEDFLALGDKQSWQCVGCLQELSKDRQGTANSAHIDHDHASGKVRGLLCLSCNHALGKVRDDVEILKRLIDYLKESFQ